MQVTRVAPEQWPRLRKRVLAFVANFRDRHITPETSAKFRAVRKEAWKEEGSVMLVATEGKRLLGVLACRNFGRAFSLAVVRRSERSKGVGKELLQRAVAELGEFYVEIASDNVPSLKLAFACGLTAYSVFVRDSGKVVLRLRVPPPSNPLAAAQAQL